MIKAVESYREILRLGDSGELPAASGARRVLQIAVPAAPELSHPDHEKQGKILIIFSYSL
jgi:hypothetical protein